MTRVRLGVDRVIDDPHLLPPGRVGLLTNDAARRGEDPAAFSRRALRDAGIDLVRLFSPEHGLTARARDGAPVADGHDVATGLPVVSLYGDRMRPMPADLAGLDAMLVDLPDVGARFYTYAWTMTHVLDACAVAGIPVTVLDRPNPLGGIAAEGPILDDDCQSLSGRLRIPVRHGLTIGELALLWRRERCPGLALRVLACDGWERAMHWPDTRLPFVPMSPAMPSYESALWYPGICLFEATNVGVGRGSDRPFRILEAAWLDAAGLARDAREHGALGSSGVTPDGPHRVALTAPAPRAFTPVHAGLALMALVRARHPREFGWAAYPTAANPGGAGHLARLAGRRDLQSLIDRGLPIPPGIGDVGPWWTEVEEILLYPRAA